MWSIGNEVLEQWSDAQADTLSLEEANLILNFGHSADMLAKEGEESVNSLLTKKLADFVRTLDPTRPITAGCNEPNPANHLFRSGALDIIGYNYHNVNIPEVPKNFPGKPFIITESNSALMTRGYYRMPSDQMFIWPERWDKPFYDSTFACSSYENCHVPWGNTHEESLLLIKKKTITFVDDRLHIKLPEDEWGFVAMHFVNAQYGKENTNVKKIITFVRDVNNFILNELDIKPDEDSLFYHRYMTHLNFFAQRVAGGVHYSDDNDIELSLLKKHYREEYKVSCDVANYIKKNYHFKPNKDEIMYLTIHLAHITRHAV